MHVPSLFVPALWSGKREITAFSKAGYAGNSWQLPDDWSNVQSVDIFRITLEGCVPLKQSAPITDGKLTLSLGNNEAISIVPAG